MKTLVRSYETTEARVEVYNRGLEYRFIIELYNEDNSTMPSYEKIAILPSTMVDMKPIIEGSLGFTNCYDLNDWRVM